MAFRRGNRTTAPAGSDRSRRSGLYWRSSQTGTLYFARGEDPTATRRVRMTWLSMLLDLVSREEVALDLLVIRAPPLLERRRVDATELEREILAEDDGFTERQ